MTRPLKICFTFYLFFQFHTWVFNHIKYDLRKKIDREYIFHYIESKFIDIFSLFIF